MKIEESNNHLINDLVALIENGKNQLAYAANATMTLTYWNIGKRINDEVLDNQRAEYGKKIVVSVARQLSWTHFIALIPIKDELQRDFYTQMCRIEGWNVKTLRKKIDSMLFERTALSKKPDDLIKEELKTLKETDKLTSDLVFTRKC